MSKRTNGHALNDGNDNAKRLKQTPEESANGEIPDDDAEWLAFQEIIAETKESDANSTTEAPDEEPEQEDRTNIELAEEEQASEEEVGETWDEEEFNVERRLQEQEKRKRYLEHLRSERDKKLRSAQQATEKSRATIKATTEQGATESEDDEEVEEEKGWF